MFRTFVASSAFVFTTMPSRTGSVHDAGVPRWPSISTTHMRHAPYGFMPGW